MKNDTVQCTDARKTIRRLGIIVGIILVGVLLLPGFLPITSTQADQDPFACVENWVGTGANEAAVAIDWNDGKNPETLIWGYRWNGSASGQDMLNAIVAAESRLSLYTKEYGGELGTALEGIGYDLDNDGFTRGPDETCDPSDPNDHFCHGWFSGYWSYWLGTDTDTEDWLYSPVGMTNRSLSDGDWDGWSYTTPAIFGFGEPPDLPDACTQIEEPTATATPTDELTATATATRTPTKTPAATATNTPTPSGGMSEEPEFATCPTGMQELGRVESFVRRDREPRSRHYSLDLPYDATVKVFGYAMEGHPESCPGGSNCGQGQLFEEFSVAINDKVIGTYHDQTAGDAWFAIDTWATSGVVPSGNLSVKVAHLLNGPAAESVSFKLTICADGQDITATPTDEPTATATPTNTPTPTSTPQSPGPSLEERIDAADEALEWMASIQEPSGAIGQQGPHIDSMLSFAARGIPVSEWPVSATGNSMVDYLRSIAPTYARYAPATGKTIAAIVAIGEDPRNFGGIDYVARLYRYYNPATGTFTPANIYWDTEWAVMGLKAAGEPIPAAIRNAYVAEARPDGCFGQWGASGDDVGFALMTLDALGVEADAPVIQNALACARNTLMGTDGGFSGGVFTPNSNANSTAFMIMGLLAVGEDPLSAAWTVGDPPANPYSYILSLQQSDGRIWWQATQQGSALIATHQSVPAILGQPYTEIPYGAPVANSGATGDGSPLTEPVLPDGVIQTTIAPDMGGALNAGGVNVHFPIAAVTAETDLVFTQLDQPAHPLPKDIVALDSFTLDAYTWPDGEEVTRFQRDYILSVTYDHADLSTQGVDASSLKLAYWDEDAVAWVTIPSTQEVDNTRLVSRLDHFTEFALLGTIAGEHTPEDGLRDKPNQVYLPLLIR